MGVFITLVVAAANNNAIGKDNKLTLAFAQ